MYSTYIGTLIGFVEGQVQVDGMVRLQLAIGSQPCVMTMEIDFLIVSTHNSTYDAILGRPSLNKIRVIVSTPHLLMKFPTNRGISQVRVDLQVIRRCYIASLRNCNLEEVKIDLEAPRKSKTPHEC